MELNFPPGKSEALPIWRGPLSKSARRQLFKENNSVSFAVPGKMILLNFVTRYKHLGTLTDMGSSVSSEVAVKSMVIKTETKRMASKILGNPSVPVSGKTSFAQTYIWSK